MLTKIINQDTDGSKLSRVFAQLGRYQSFIIMLAMSGIALYGREFILILAGEDYLDGYVVAMLLMIPYTVDLIQNSGNTIMQAENKYWYRARILFSAAIVNIVMTYFGAKKYGMYGAAGATTITIVITSWFIMNYVYSKKINLDIKFFWKEVLPVWGWGIFPLLVGRLIGKIQIENLFVQFTVHVILYLIVYFIFLWSIIMKPNEKKYLIGNIAKGHNKSCL